MYKSGVQRRGFERFERFEWFERFEGFEWFERFGWFEWFEWFEEFGYNRIIFVPVFRHILSAPPQTFQTLQTIQTSQTIQTFKLFKQHTMSVQLNQAKNTAKRIGRRLLWIILGVFLLICTGYYAYSQFSYSDGYRSGQLVKISRRGVIFKTYEGTLNLSPNGMMTAWEFSVKNGKVASELEGLEGKQIRVHYLQRYQTFFWQGDTEYIVDGVEGVQ